MVSEGPIGKSPYRAYLQNFVTKLKDHLLMHLFNLDYDGDEHSFPDGDRNTVEHITLAHMFH